MSFLTLQNFLTQFLKPLQNVNFWRSALKVSIMIKKLLGSCIFTIHSDNLKQIFQLISVGIWIMLLMYVRCVTCISNISTGNNQNADLSFKLMSKCCPYMRHIHVADCQWITEAAVKVISPLKHIFVLNMADCTRYYITSDFCNHCKGIVLKLILF